MTPIPKCPCRGCPEEMVNAEPVEWMRPFFICPNGSPDSSAHRAWARVAELEVDLSSAGECWIMIHGLRARLEAANIERAADAYNKAVQRLKSDQRGGVMRKRFKALGRDLYFDTECSCPDPKWIGSTAAHLFKNRVRLTGYADDHFFDRVNAEPRQGACQCGRIYHYQWFRDGVEIEFEATP